MNHEGWLFSFAKVPRNRAWLTAFHIPSADLLHSTHFVASGLLFLAYLDQSCWFS